MNEPKTQKQREFFQALPSSRSQTEAAIKAGYSPASAKVSASRNITKYNDFLFTILEKAEINTDSLAQALKAGMSEKDPKLKFKYMTLLFKILERAFDSNADPAEIPDVPTASLEGARDKLIAKLMAIPYRQTDIAFVKKSQLPEGIQEFSPQEVIELLGFNEEEASMPPRTSRINYAAIARSRLPAQTNNDATDGAN